MSQITKAIKFSLLGSVLNFSFPFDNSHCLQNRIRISQKAQQECYLYPLLQLLLYFSYIFEIHRLSSFQIRLAVHAIDFA